MTREPSVEATIRALEDRRFDAMVRADVAALDELLSEWLVYSHTRGNRDTNTSYLERVRDGDLAYLSITHPVEQVLFTGNTAVVVGHMCALARVGGVERHMDNGCIAVWAKQGHLAHPRPPSHPPAVLTRAAPQPAGLHRFSPAVTSKACSVARASPPRR